MGIALPFIRGVIDRPEILRPFTGSPIPCIVVMMWEEGRWSESWMFRSLTTPGYTKEYVAWSSMMARPSTDKPDFL